ncbi:unnamed protein product [Dovyalis caffra]|uniref:Ribosomal protein S3 n=1 Tax=Dovyalis caffra TaxID=77055 RepID=A0AAV1RFV8_9ROSI|nr:unnamed protein product [Dovyalis caffra]
MPYRTRPGTLSQLTNILKQSTIRTEIYRSFQDYTNSFLRIQFYQNRVEIQITGYEDASMDLEAEVKKELGRAKCRVVGENGRCGYAGRRIDKRFSYKVPDRNMFATGYLGGLGRVKVV